MVTSIGSGYMVYQFEIYTIWECLLRNITNCSIVGQIKLFFWKLTIIWGGPVKRLWIDKEKKLEQNLLKKLWWSSAWRLQPFTVKEDEPSVRKKESRFQNNLLTYFGGWCYPVSTEKISNLSQLVNFNDKPESYCAWKHSFQWVVNADWGLDYLFYYFHFQIK